MIEVVCTLGTVLIAFIWGAHEGFMAGERAKEIGLRIRMHRGEDINQVLRDLP